MTGAAVDWAALRDRAEALGQEHGKAGIKPYGNLGTADDRARTTPGPLFMAGVGAQDSANLTGCQVQELLNTYHGGWCWGAWVCFGCGASGATEDVNADLYCKDCASEWNSA